VKWLGQTTVCRIFSFPPSPLGASVDKPLFDIVWDDFRLRSLRELRRDRPMNRLVTPKRQRRGGGRPQAPSLPVVIGAGSHPFPFRTRKLSLLPPMVLHGKLCGRVGRCRHYYSRVRRQLGRQHTVSHAGMGSVFWAASQARRRCGRVGRCRHCLKARELRFEGFHVYAGSSVTAHQFSMPHGALFWGPPRNSAVRNQAARLV
jgi:hypothetical protein